ncbi:MAG: hypothetical protein OEV11_03690 [Deltaproteobacteria bacterium]|nr:hypothetical protein [Deltaproteobacteria bacterium]
MAVLQGVLGCRNLRRTIQVRLGSGTLRLPGGTPIFTVSRQQLKLPAASCRESSKCKELIPFYCSSLAPPRPPQADYGGCARWSIFMRQSGKRSDYG